MDTEPFDGYHKLIRPAIVCVVAITLLFIGYQIYLSRHFRVVNTNPKTGNVATVSPFLKINFNRQLSSKDLSVTSSYSVISSYKVEGKTLVVNLKVPMTAGYEYYIKINHIDDVKGDVITNRMLRFAPKKISSKDLPEDQKQALLKTQSNRPRSKNSIVFTGANTLLDYGLSSSQLNNLEQYFFDFAPRAKTVSITQVTPVPHNPNASSTNDSMNFKARVDSSSYNANMVYSNLNDYLRLVLSNPKNGSTTYDSSAVKGGKEGGVD